VVGLLSARCDGGVDARSTGDVRVAALAEVKLLVEPMAPEDDSRAEAAIWALWARTGSRPTPALIRRPNHPGHTVISAIRPRASKGAFPSGTKRRFAPGADASRRARSNRRTQSRGGVVGD